MMDLRCSFLVVSSGKLSAQVEAQLAAEHRQRAGAGAVGLARAALEHLGEEVEVCCSLMRSYAIRAKSSPALWKRSSGFLASSWSRIGW